MRSEAGVDLPSLQSIGESGRAILQKMRYRHRRDRGGASEEIE
jgi:hypothetical protein